MHQTLSVLRKLTQSTLSNTFRSGGVYRFRIIHSGSVYPFQLSVDGHKLKVVATDGIELRDPVMADSVIVNTGERYDFELHATHVVDNYWIKAKTLEVRFFLCGMVADVSVGLGSSVIGLSLA